MMVDLHATSKTNAHRRVRGGDASVRQHRNHSLSQLEKTNLKRKTTWMLGTQKKPHPCRFRKDDLERFRRDTARQRLSPPRIVVVPQRPGLERRGELPTESDRTRALCPGATFRYCPQRRCAPCSQPHNRQNRHRQRTHLHNPPPGTSALRPTPYLAAAAKLSSTRRSTPRQGAAACRLTLTSVTWPNCPRAWPRACSLVS